MDATPSAAGPLPHDWSVNHDAPTDFIVRCTHCGRIGVHDDRAGAHSKADEHALRCRPTGVTPTKTPDDEPTPGAEPAVNQPTASDGGLDVLGADLTGTEIAVRYESVSTRAGEQQVIGDVVTMFPAPSSADFQYKGLIVRLGNQTRRRVDLLRDIVECPHNCDDGWRKTGDLTGLAPAQRADNTPVVMTDGGQVVEEAEEEENGDDEDDEPETQPDTLTQVIEAGTLQQTVGLLKTAADECILHLGRDGLNVSLVDPASVYMVHIDLDAAAFDRVGDGSFAIGADLNRLGDIVSKADNDQLIELVLDLETRKFHIEFGNVEMDLAGIDPDSIRNEPDLPELDLSNEFEIQAKELQRAVDICGMVSDHVTIEGDTTDECIRFIGEGDIDDAQVELREELGFTDVTEDEGSMYSIGSSSTGSSGYLTDAFNAIPKTTPTTIHFDHEFPVLIEWEYAEGNGEVVQMVAPRIQTR